VSRLLTATPASFPTPWAARAFALVSAVAEGGWFELRDFQQALISAIGARESQGACIADEAAYYDCWVEALTTQLRDKGIPAARLEAAEAAIRQRLATLLHDHDHDNHDEPPRPIHVEPAR
jgi:nitrile hydratase accessory protein